MTSRGYEPLEEFASGFAERHGHDVHMRRRRGSHRIDVELHWRIGTIPPRRRLITAASAPTPRSPDRRRARPGSRAPGAAALPGRASPERPHQAAHLGEGRRRDFRGRRRVRVAAGVRNSGRARPRVGSPPRARLRGSPPGPRPSPPATSRSSPPWGPLRAVEDLDARASTHVGRLAALSWRDRPRYLRSLDSSRPEPASEAPSGTTARRRGGSSRASEDRGGWPQAARRG